MGSDPFMTLLSCDNARTAIMSHDDVTSLEKSDLTSLEKSIVRFSLRRYDRPFYRRGHLLGWLLIPLAMLSVLPSFSRFRWIGGAIYILMFVWYAAVVTRVIGKLASRLNIVLWPVRMV